MPACGACYKENASHVCGACKKRPYCSRQCQQSDWRFHKPGCQHQAGEVDIDWVIRDSPGKGLGLFALRDFAAHDVIMGERAYTWQELKKVGPNTPLRSEIDALEPRKGSLQDKFDLNCFGMRDPKTPSTLAVRSSRINHACLCNAHHYQYKNLSVKFLVAKRAIAQGEEITIDYASPLRWEHEPQFSETWARSLLQDKWDIRCPESCPCQDLRELEFAREMRDLDRKAAEMANTKPRQALEVVRKRNLLEQRRTGHVGFRGLYDAFQICVALEEWKEAKKYARQYQEHDRKIPGLNASIPHHVTMMLNMP